MFVCVYVVVVCGGTQELAGKTNAWYVFVSVFVCVCLCLCVFVFVCVHIPCVLVWLYAAALRN